MFTFVYKICYKPSSVNTLYNYVKYKDKFFLYRDRCIFEIYTPTGYFLKLDKNPR